MLNEEEYQSQGYDWEKAMSKRRQINKILLVFLWLTFALINVCFSVHAQTDEESEVPSEEGGEVDTTVDTTGTPLPAIYLPLKPAFVVNYGGKGHLRYLKTEMSVRLATSDAANSVRHHLPFIRNNLVMLFARQTEETMNSQEGREKMRQDALAEIQKIVLEEDGTEGVLDVYFNTFIVQN